MTQPLTDAINALTRYANEVTGQSDTNLSDAVRTLCDGYGGGGGFTADQIADRSLITGDIVLTVSYVYQYGFKESNISSVSSDSIASLGNYAFGDCPTLKSAYFPNLDGSIGSYTFQNCVNLETIYLPKCITITGYNFRNCNKLEEVMLPNLANTGNSATGAMAFYGCPKLKTVDLGKCVRIDGNAFHTCRVLEALILRRTSICALSDVNAFTHSPFASGGSGGTIYIPEALYDELGTGSSLDYKSATNWSTIDGYGTITWAKIEGSIYE